MGWRGGRGGWIGEGERRRQLGFPRLSGDGRDSRKGTTKEEEKKTEGHHAKARLKTESYWCYERNPYIL